MDEQSSHFHFGGGAGNPLLPVSAFSAYSLLRNCNYLLSSQAPEKILSMKPQFSPHHVGHGNISSKSSSVSEMSPVVAALIIFPSTLVEIPTKIPALPVPTISPECPAKSPSAKDDGPPSIDAEKSFFNLPPKSFLASAPLFGYPHHLHLLQNEQLNSRSANVVSPCSPLFNSSFRRQRGEKKPIPEEQKDEKYFERRRRNNQAAKKSRDARKMREDQIALRATILEHENAVLRAQVLTLREETSSLRQMLLQKKTLEFSARDTQICR